MVKLDSLLTSKNFSNTTMVYLRITALSITALLIFSCGTNLSRSEKIDDLIESNKLKEASELILEEGVEGLEEQQVIRVAQAFSEKVNFEVSIPLMRKAVEIDSTNNVSKLLLANNLRENKDYNEALKLYNELSSVDSIEFMVLPERARLYIHLNEFEKAQVDIERSKYMQPKYFAIYLADGLFQYAKGREQEALDMFEVADQYDPGVSSEASLYAGFILLKNNLNYDALSKFTKAIEVRKNINLGYAFINRGVCQINLQDTAFACNDWDSARHYMPEQAEHYINQYCK